MAGGRLTGTAWWQQMAAGGVSLWALVSQGAALAVVLAFVAFESARLAMRRPWFSVGMTLLFGAVCGLPFFLFMRERHMQSSVG